MQDQPASIGGVTLALQLHLRGHAVSPELAMAAFRAGDRAKALLMLDALLATNPTDGKAWLVRGWALEQLGLLAEAIPSANNARRFASDNRDAHVLASRLAARDGRPADAEAIATEALATFPDDPWLNNIKGKILAARSESAQAIPYLRTAAAALGNGEESFWTYATTLAIAGEYAELLSLQDRMDELSGPGLHPFGYYRHLALAKLSLHHDRARVLDDIRATEASPRWLDGAALLARLGEAVHARRPLSFIRMGDGEARLLCYLDAEVQQMLRPPERVAMIDSVWVNWFAQGVEEFDAADVADLGARLLDACATSDIVGIPAAESIVHDNYHYGFMARMQHDILRVGTGEYTPAMIHNDMHHRQPFLGDLLRGLPFLGFVGCHPDLAPRLARYHGIADTRSYLVPGENGRDQLPADLRTRGHFPGVFREIMDRLEVPFTGAVFLVGAGVCGKIYCARIRTLGGIAIDIGSLADSWMGFNTRPGQYDNIAQWVLPAT